MDVQGWITLTNTAARPTPMPTPCWSPARSARRSQRYARLSAAAAAAARHAPARAPRRRAASGSAISISIRCRSGRRSPTTRPSRSASSTSTAARPQRAYEYPQRLARHAATSRPAPTRAAILQARASGGLGDALPAGTVRVYQRDARGNAAVRRRTARSAIRRWGRTSGSPPARRSTSRSSRSVEKRERVIERRQPRWRTAMRYTLTNASPRAGDRRPRPGGPVGRHADRRGKP